MPTMQDFKHKLAEKRERRKIYDQKYEKQKRKNRYQSTASTNKKTLCICPKCGEKHYLDILWIGKNTPRKYCHPCRLANSRISAGAIPEHSQEVYR